MKKLFVAIAIPVSLIFSGCNGDSGKGEAITLKFNLPRGASYDYRIDMDMTMEGNSAGQPVTMVNKVSTGYKFDVKDDSAGWKKLSANITRMAMDIDAGGMKIHFDSDKPSDTSAMAGNKIPAILGAMKGSEFYFTINEKGEVGQVTGVQEMIRHAVSAVHDPNALAILLALGDEENFKQNIQQSFSVYPGKPVKEGDQWTNSTTLNNQGLPMKMDNTYTLESVSGNTAKVKVNSKISSPGGSTLVDVAGITEGAMIYDIPTGVPLDADLDMKVAMNSGAQSNAMSIAIKIKITGKKS